MESERTRLKHSFISLVRVKTCSGITSSRSREQHFLQRTSVSIRTILRTFRQRSTAATGSFRTLLSILFRFHHFFDPRGHRLRQPCLHAHHIDCLCLCTTMADSKPFLSQGTTDLGHIQITKKVGKKLTDPYLHEVSSPLF